MLQRAQQPLRVVHVVGGTLAGSTRVVLNLARHHDRARIRPSVCFFSIVPAHAEARAELDALGVPWLDVVKRSRYELGALGRLRRALAELRPDVAVVHGFGSYSYGAAAARQAGARAVVRVEHSPELHGVSHRWVSAMSAPWCDSTVLVSRYVGAYLAEQGTTLPHPEVIENGIDLAAFAGMARAPFVLSGRAPTALMVARLDYAKDHATLIDAVALLARRGVPLTVRLAGDGPLRAELEARARAAGAGDRVQFLGHRSDLPALWESADIGVLTSHFEGFGLAVAEAMAAGRPVVATRVASLPELVEEGVHGFLVPPCSPAAVADALAILCADPERARRMGEAGRARAAERWALVPSVRAFERHLERTAERVGLTRSRSR